MADECDTETICYWKWSLKYKKFLRVVPQNTLSLILKEEYGLKAFHLGSEKDIWA
jgi:hypothetical protein